MKWTPFIILALIVLVCQTTIVPLMAIHSIWPNWLFVLAVHYALWGPWPDVAIAAWFLGLALDLQTARSGGAVGLYSLLFGGSAWVILRARQALFRDHPVTQLLVTLVFCLAIELVVEVYRRWGSAPTPWSSGPFWPALFTALYTAAWTPYLNWPLNRLGRWTGLRPDRR